MANIRVNDLLNLNLTGTDLFNDSESFLKELSEDDNQIFGGGINLTFPTPSCNCANTSVWCKGESMIMA
ncbi:hypothetical protein H6G64_18180 [Calothrix sp. FACHB-156]|nr:hypothetical protein [Nostoc linckia FACHB-104]MBD2338904.1 hypothetical protein [Calothrix sp. FACHB-156]